jgi:hypothetical protein
MSMACNGFAVSNDACWASYAGGSETMSMVDVAT